MASAINLSEYDQDTTTALRCMFKDVYTAAESMEVDEARFVVDSYYQFQDARLRSAGQIRATEGREPNAALGATYEVHRIVENSLKNVLGRYAKRYAVGAWLQGICGIGPVISAGLLANLDIRRAPTCGNFWSFCGLNPDQEWKKGQKRPWSAKAKVLCFNVGESFVKVQSREADVYGKLFKARKEREIERNEAGEYAGQAAAKLEKFKIGKNTDAYAAYSQGKLPPAHLHARARRWAVKLFLSHLHSVMYLDFHGKEGPKPYAFTEFLQEEHVHFIDPPPFNPEPGQKGLKDLYKDLDEEKEGSQTGTTSEG